LTKFKSNKKIACEEAKLEFLLFCKFGSLLLEVAVQFEVLYQKTTKMIEAWNMIDGSFITTLPDTWSD
jgi:arginine decarboxylase